MHDFVQVAEYERIKAYENSEVKGKFNVGIMLTDAVWLMMNEGGMTKDAIIRAVDETFDTLKIYSEKKFT